MRFIESGPYRVAIYELRGRQACSAWYTADPRRLETRVKLGEADTEEGAKELCRRHALARRLDVSCPDR